MLFRRRLAPLCLTIALFAGCATAPPEEEVPSAELYYRHGLETLEGSRFLFFFRDVDFARAIEFFQEVIDNYPYSEYSTLAELKIADVQFERRNFEEAASYYQDFIELHPKHQRVPYALLRNGLSSFEQMREPDQDPEHAQDAIAHFQVLLERHPGAEEATQAQSLLARVRDQLAQHDVAVAEFYYGREEYHAAISRYRRAIERSPTHTGHLQTRTQIARALKLVGRPFESERLFLEVLAEQPEGDLLDLVEDELHELRTEVSRGDARPLKRSCATDPNPACGRGLAPTP